MSPDDWAPEDTAFQITSVQPMTSDRGASYRVELTATNGPWEGTILTSWVPVGRRGDHQALRSFDRAIHDLASKGTPE